MNSIFDHSGNIVFDLLVDGVGSTFEFANSAVISVKRYLLLARSGQAQDSSFRVDDLFVSLAECRQYVAMFTHHSDQSQRSSFVEAQELEVFEELAKIIRDRVRKPGVGFQCTHETVLGLSAQRSHDSGKYISDFGVVSSFMRGTKEDDTVCAVHDALINTAMLGTDQCLWNN